MAKTHGRSKTKEYISWIEMRKRCRNPKVIRYPLYGGAGVTVCDRWYNSFELFLEDMGMMPEGKTSLDRYPNSNGNYEPGNCRWADDYEQSNNKRNNVLVIIDGVQMTLTQAEKALGRNRAFLQNRIRRGASIEESIRRPFGRSRKLHEYNGEYKSIKEWCETLNITETTFRWRLLAKIYVSKFKELYGYEPYKINE